MAKPVTILNGDFKGHASNEQKAQRKDAKEEMFQQVELTTAPPEFFNNSATKEWNRIVPVLKKDLPVSEADYGMLVAYCLAFARIEAAEKEIKANGTFMKAANGAKIANPAIKVQSSAISDLKMAAHSLGMTMAERSRIALQKAKSKTSSDPFESLMENG